jgi:cobalt-zinc-cadmium efflux system protein
MNDQAKHEHHAHDHTHHHEHSSRNTPVQLLSLALALTGTFMLAEVAAGFLTHSLALLSDAAHMLTDAAALGIAIAAQRFAQKSRTSKHTFGFRRAEVLAALLNGLFLGVSAVLIVIEAVKRLREPPEVAGLTMLAVASIGLVFNLISAKVLSSGTESNANVRAAAAHVMADAAGSVAAILAGALVLAFGWNLADPIISTLISLLILWSAWRLVRSSVDVLMDTTPAGLDVALIEQTILQTPGVTSLHDLHIWSVSEGAPLLSVHVVTAAGAHGTAVAHLVNIRLRERFDFSHNTIQPEAVVNDELTPLGWPGAQKSLIR